jgi:hypothetical protein
MHGVTRLWMIELAKFDDRYAKTDIGISGNGSFKWIIILEKEAHIALFTMLLIKLNRQMNIK